MFVHFVQYLSALQVWQPWLHLRDREYVPDVDTIPDIVYLT